jgi:hypothetical protein
MWSILQTRLSLAYELELREIILKREEGAMVVEPFFWRRHGLLRGTIVPQSLGSFSKR